MAPLPPVRWACSLLWPLLASARYAPAEPVIGVLTFPGGHVDLNNETCVTGCGPGSNIFSGYVPWIQQAGARVVPLKYDSSETELRAAFTKVNGVLFTGGAGKPLDFPQYFAAATLLYRLVVEAHEHGDDVPLWGTCLGLQTLVCVAAGGADVLGDYPLFGYSYPLDFAPAAFSSKMFAGMEPLLWKDFSGNVTTHFHHFGIGLDMLAERAPDFVPLGTNVDLNGRVFVSVFEGRAGLPVYAVQFHPEMNQFMSIVPSWTIPSRSAEAIRTVQYLANFFVDHARGNEHAFDSMLEESLALVERTGTLHADAVDTATPDLYPLKYYSFSPASSGSCASE